MHVSIASKATDYLRANVTCGGYKQTWRSRPMEYLDLGLAVELVVVQGVLGDAC